MPLSAIGRGLAAAGWLVAVVGLATRPLTTLRYGSEPVPLWLTYLRRWAPTRWADSHGRPAMSALAGFWWRGAGIVTAFGVTAVLVVLAAVLARSRLAAGAAAVAAITTTVLACLAITQTSDLGAARYDSGSPHEMFRRAGGTLWSAPARASGSR